MSNRLRPVVGRWYNHLDKGSLFQVVALDAASGTIEVQEFDGDLDEFEPDEWRQMSLEAAAPPEDWTGPVDEIDTDDLGYTDTLPHERSSEPVDVASIAWEEEVEDESDEFDEPLPRSPPGHPHRNH